MPWEQPAWDFDQSSSQKRIQPAKRPLPCPRQLLLFVKAPRRCVQQQPLRQPGRAPLLLRFASRQRVSDPLHPSSFATTIPNARSRSHHSTPHGGSDGCGFWRLSNQKDGNRFSSIHIHAAHSMMDCVAATRSDAVKTRQLRFASNLFIQRVMNSASGGGICGVSYVRRSGRLA